MSSLLSATMPLGIGIVLITEGYSMLCERHPSRSVLIQKLCSRLPLPAELGPQPDLEPELASQSLQLARTFLGKLVEVTMDRPLGSAHPYWSPDAFNSSRGHPFSSLFDLKRFERSTPMAATKYSLESSSRDLLASVHIENG